MDRRRFAASLALVLLVGPARGGSERWESRYNGPAHRSDVPTDMTMSPDGTRVYVTGYSYDRVDYLEYTTISYDAATGKRLWVSRLHEYYSEAFGIAVSPDGADVYVTGMVDGPAGRLGTVAYDASTGARLWFVRYGHGSSKDIAVSPDGGRVYVTGSSARGAPSDYATIAYDATTGARLWISSYDGPDQSDDEAAALQLDPDGTRLYVTGASCGIGTGHDYATVAYDATNGTELWVARYAGPHPGDCPLDLGDRPSSLAVSSAGTTIAVTGQSPNEDAFQDVTTIAYDADGTQRWVQRYEATGSNPFAGGTSVAVGPDGGVFVLGTISSNEGDLITISYDGVDGTVRWESPYDGPGHGLDVSRSLRVDPSGTNVYVTGRAYDGFSDDYATLAIDATTGDQLWAALYDGPAHAFDWPYAIAIRPDGTMVYVTGNSVARNSDDFLTVAYSA